MLKIKNENVMHLLAWFLVVNYSGKRGNKRELSSLEANLQEMKPVTILIFSFICDSGYVVIILG